MTPSLSSSCSLSVISSVKPVDPMGLGLVGHFSAAQQPLDHSRGHRRKPSVVDRRSSQAPASSRRLGPLGLAVSSGDRVGGIMGWP